jgi:hypothetical protein
MGVVNSYPTHASNRTGPRLSTGWGGAPNDWALEVAGSNNPTAAPRTAHSRWVLRWPMQSTEEQKLTINPEWRRLKYARRAVHTLEARS